MIGLDIRAAEPDDIDAMMRLITQMAEYEKLTHQLKLRSDDLHQALFGAQPAAFADVAVLEGALVGHAIWFYNFSSFLGKRGIWLEDIIVDEKKRGQGIGKALFTHMMHKARAQKAGRLEFSVLDWNQPAIAFYQKHGAEVMPDWRICRLDETALESITGGTQ